MQRGRQQQRNAQFADADDNHADNHAFDRCHDHDYIERRITALGDHRGWFARDVRE